MAPLSAYTPVTTHARDSLELASLVGSSPGDEEDESEGRQASSRASLSSHSSSSRKLSLEHDEPLFPSSSASNHRPNRPNRPNHPNHPNRRTFSISSTHDFANQLFPLSASTTAAGYSPLGAPTSATLSSGQGPGGGSLEKHKTLTYLNGLSLIVGLIIGSGIFASPGHVSAQVGSPGGSLVIWLVAGVLSWTGAASYAELGSAIPLNGGTQAYLSKMVGELAGFLFTWTAALVLKPGSAAIVCIIMGEYFVHAVVGAEAATVNPWVSKSVALLGLLIVTLFNTVSTRLAIRTNNALMFFKFVALAGVVTTGIFVAATGHSFDGTPNLDWKSQKWFDKSSTDPSVWAVALYAGLWAYDGWDNTNFVLGEFRNPSRDLPRIIHTAMPIVIASYILVNIAYFIVLPLADINSSNTVAVAFGFKVFGPIGSLVIALVVSASCFGALNSNTFGSSRIVYAAGKEGFIPSIFGTLGFTAHARSRSRYLSDPRHDNYPRGRPRAGWLSRWLRSLVADEDTALFFTPIYALVLNAGLTAVYVVVGEFGTLMTFYGAAGYTFYFLTVLGLIVLRIREPDLERPYRTWIANPIIFCCVSLFLLSRAVFAHPIQTLLVVAFVLSGVPVYFWLIRARGGNRRRGKREGLSGSAWWKIWAW